MRRIWEAIIRLFLVIARSSVLSWIMLLLLVIGIGFDAFGLIFYKIICIILALEVVIINANTYDAEELMRIAWHNKRMEEESKEKENESSR